MFLVQLLLLLLALWICGVGLVVLILNPEESSFSEGKSAHCDDVIFAIAPVIPLTLLSIIGWFVYETFQLSVGQTAVPALCLLLAIGGVGWFRRLRLCKALFRRATSELLLPIVVTGMLICLTSVLQWFGNSGLPLTIEGVDWPSYAQISRFLRDQDLNSPAIGLNLQNYEWYRSVIRWNVFGIFYDIAFVSTIGKVTIPLAMSLLLHSHFFILLILSYVLNRQIFRLSNFFSIGLLFLYGLSPLVLHVTSSGYLSQTVSLTLFVSLILTMHSLVLPRLQVPSTGTKRLRPLLSAGVLSGFLVSGILNSYSHMLGPILMVLFISATLSLLGNRHSDPVSHRSVVIFCLFFVSVTLICSLDRLQEIILNTKTLFQTTAGPSFATLNSDVLFGFDFHPLMKSTSQWTRQITNMFIIFCLFRSFKSMKTEASGAFPLSVAIILTTVFTLGVMTALNVPSRGYKTYKILTYFLIFFLPIVLFSVSRFRLGKPLFVVLLCFNFYHWTAYTKEIYAHGKRLPLSETPEDFRFLNAQSSLNVITLNDVLDRQWLTFLFQERTASFFDSLFLEPGDELAADHYVFAFPPLAKSKEKHLLHFNGPTGALKDLSPCQAPAESAVCFRLQNQLSLLQLVPVCQDNHMSISLPSQALGVSEVMFRLIAAPEMGFQKYEIWNSDTKIGGGPCGTSSTCSGKINLPRDTQGIKIVGFLNSRPRICTLSHLDTISW